MGCSASVQASRASFGKFKPIPDSFKSFEEVTAALRTAGLESSQLVVGVDFTKSNKWTGKKTFAGRCLHDLQPGLPANPYQQVLTIIAKTLGEFDDDNEIPAYGFGDLTSKDHSVFSFQPGDEPCDGLEGVLRTYEQLTSVVNLSGPTSFAPLIRHVTELVRRTNEYHILVIVADGQVDQVQDTVDAIVDASHYALSIVCVGVGDGPWETMKTFDDELPARQFDNFQFVEFNELMKKYPDDRRDAAFAMHALMEIPEQYTFLKKSGLLSADKQRPKLARPKPPLNPPTSGRVRSKSQSGFNTPVNSEPGERASFCMPGPRGPASAFNTPGVPAAPEQSLRRGNTLKNLAPLDAAALRDNVQALMNETWSSRTTRDRGFQKVSQFEVVQVLQNDNADIWRSYSQRQAEIARSSCLPFEQRFGSVMTETSLFERSLGLQRRKDCNEFFLFHGTNPAAAQKICAADFRLDLSGMNVGNLYGPGIYFAENSSKADEYAEDDEEGLYKGLYAMLLCRVCLGNPAFSAEVDPDVSKLQKRLANGECHSILGDRAAAVGTYREFIIQDPRQAYPAFAIIYRRKDH